MPQYTGSREPAIVSASSAPTLASDSMAALLLGYAAGTSIFEDAELDGSIDETVQGAQGGSMRVRGELRNGLGSLSATYSAFAEDGVVINGRETFEILEQASSVATGTYNSRVKHTFEDYSVAAAGEPVYTLWGSVLAVRSPTQGATNLLNSAITGELLITQSGSAIQHLLSDISLNRTFHQPDVWSDHPEWQITGSARLYTSNTGRVDLDIEAPLLIAVQSGSDGMTHGGNVVLEGAGGTRLWISALTREYAALELDETGDGTPDRSLAYRWEEGFTIPAGARDGVLAITGPDLSLHGASSGPLVQLEGRFSESTSGNFLSHSWSIEMSPPGSTASLQDPQTTRPTILVDRNGMYLFRLRVSDGEAVSDDYMTLHVHFLDGAPQVEDPGNLPPEMSDRRQARVVVEPDVIVVPGSSLSLEGRRSHTPDGAPLQSQRWTVRNFPSGSIALEAGAETIMAVASDKTQRADFSAQRAFSGDLDSGSGLAIIPPSNRRMAPTFQLPLTLADYNAGVIAVGDLNGDSIDDIVLLIPGSPSRVRILLGSRGGRLVQQGPDLVYADGFSINPRGHLADLNGDGRVDVLLEDPVGLSVFLQTGNEAAPWAERQIVPSGCGRPTKTQLADADGDGDLDIFARHECAPSGIGIYLASDAGLAAPIPAILPGNPYAMYAFVALDLNADGHADLAGVNQFNALSVWHAGATAGTFAAAPAFPAGFDMPYQAQQIPVAGDLDGNGRADLVVGGTSVLILWQAADHGLTVTSLQSSDWPSGAETVVALKDFDADGRVDILTGSGWYRQEASGVFADWQPYTRGLAAFAGDVNGDGLLDLLNQSQITLQAPRAEDPG